MKPQEFYDEISNASVYSVKKSDLPLCCPTNNAHTWDQHPRIYLPITDTGVAVCPYCHNTYRLINEPN